jgi:hypothetical protein
MSPDVLPVRSPRRITSLLQIQLWQLALVVAYVAIAIADIQDHGRREPVLILLASLGYAAFGLICWLSWYLAARFRRRLGTVMVTALYSFAMGGLFLAAVVGYLVIEYVYVGGRLL